MITCKDCIYFEACQHFNHQITAHPKDFIGSDKCASQCTTFKNRNEYMDSKQVLDYITKVKGGILTSRPNDCELYAILSTLEHVFKDFRLPPAKVYGGPYGDQEIYRI